MTVDPRYFYGKIERTGVVPKSSQPSANDFYQVFARHARNGDEVVAVLLSAKLSGTWQSAMTARDLVLEEYPQAYIEVIDSETAGMGLGLAVLAGARAAEGGAAAAAVTDIIRGRLRFTRIMFTPPNLEYLKKGGRIGKAAGMIGSLLRVTPILIVRDGVIDVMKKTRGFSAAQQAMREKLEQAMDRHGIAEVVVHHVTAFEKATELAEEVKRITGLQPEIVELGPVLGLHVGPGTLGIVYEKKETSVG